MGIERDEWKRGGWGERQREGESEREGEREGGREGEGGAPSYNSLIT